MAVRSFNDLVPFALALVSIAIVVAVGTIVLVEMEPSTFTDEDYNNEAHQPTDTDGINSTHGFEQYTLDNHGQKVKSLTVDYQDQSAGTNTTLTGGGTNYTLNSNTGEVNVTDVDSYDSSTGDKFFNDYTAEETTEGTSVLRKAVDAFDTFAEFFIVLVVVGIAAVLFVLLKVMRGASRQASV